VNEYQLPEDEPDSEEKALTYLEAESIGDSDPVLIKEFVKQGQRVMSAISSHTQLNWMVMNWPDYHAEFPGGLVRGRTIEPTIVHADPEVDAIVRRSPFRPERSPTGRSRIRCRVMKKSIDANVNLSLPVAGPCRGSVHRCT